MHELCMLIASPRGNPLAQLRDASGVGRPVRPPRWLMDNMALSAASGSPVPPRIPRIPPRGNSVRYRLPPCRIINAPRMPWVGSQSFLGRSDPEPKTPRSSSSPSPPLRTSTFCSWAHRNRPGSGVGPWPLQGFRKQLKF